MEIILQEDFPSLGYVGDRVSVKRGYARNYLIPRGIAVELSSRNARVLRHQQAMINAKKNRLKKLAEELGEKLREEPLSFELRVGDKGKVFGSIGTKEVHDALVAKGYELQRKQVRLQEPIRAAGTHTVQVRLHSEVLVDLEVKVEAILVKKAEKGPDKEERSKRRRASEGSAEEQEGSESTRSETDEALSAQEASSSEDSAS